jgi:hypothetical protein
MAIDFNQDIAPLRQQYFPMLVGEQAFDQAMKYRQEVLMPMQQQTMKMQEHQMRMRQQDLAYKQQKFNLRQARKTARMENEAMERIPEVVDQLNTIIDRKDQSIFDQQKDLAKLQMQYQTSAQFSPLINNLFKSASNSLSNQYKQQEEVSGMLYQAAVSGVPVDTVRAQAERDGTVTPREQIAIDISEAVQKKGLDKVQKAQADLLREQEEQRTTALIKRAEDDYGNVIKMSPVDIGEQIEAGLLEGVGEKVDLTKLEAIATKATQDVTFEATPRFQLERLYYDYSSPEKQFFLDKNPSALSKESFSDADLYRAVLRQTRAIMQSAYKKPEGPSTISSLFTPKQP